MTSMTGGEAVYQTLLAAGVEYVFGITSVHNIPIYDAIASGGGIKMIDVRHEQGALHAADGYSRATGKLGVAITSTGPGAANGMTGLFEAGFASSRVLMITGQVETWHLGKGKGVLHEAGNQLAMLRQVTRVTESVRQAQEIPTLLTRVITDILSGRPQPGAIEIPVDLQYEVADQATPSSINPAQPRPPAASLDAAAGLIADASKRFILAGGGVIRAGATEALVQLAESLDAPVYTTTNGRGAIPEDHPLSQGTFMMQSTDALTDAEVMIAVGTRFQQGNTGQFKFEPPGKLIHIDADSHSIGLNYSADVAVLGDAKLALAGLQERLKAQNAQGDAAFKAQLADKAALARQEVRQRMGEDYETIMDAMRELLPRQACIVRDATIPAYVWGNTLMPIYEPGTSMHSTSAAIGPGLPLGLGAALGTGEKSLVIQGDGGLMLNIAELATAVQYKVPVIVCIFNNQGYGVLRYIQGRRFEGRTTGVDLATPDFVKVAEGMGALGIAVGSAEEFRQALERALAHDGPVVLDIDQSKMKEMKLPF